MEETKEVYKKYFSASNLRLAWERMIRSNGRDIKDFFGIELYSIDLDKNLQRLSDFIVEGKFAPRRPFKYYEPKASKTQRTKSVLYIEDALVYQAIANKVATDNYKEIAANNDFVFGSVLHKEVALGIDLLDNPEAEFYFFEYYIPLYNKFINSVNHEIENTQIKYKLETDITGFFDCIPHSKLLITLGKIGVESQILNLLANCFNVYSGTRESITPGVGIPQGPAASSFFANVLLLDLDNLISQKGYTYYRYMDDIRIYEETEDKLIEMLVVIDSFLKGKALSLNTKKTSIQEISSDRETEKSPLLDTAYTDPDIYSVAGLGFTGKNIELQLTDQNSQPDEESKFIIKTISGDELITFCKSEIQQVTEFLKNTFKNIESEFFSPKEIIENEDVKKNIIHYSFRWRRANGILKEFSQTILDNDLVQVWLFCIEHFFWKANHFCWNLNLYGNSGTIRNNMLLLVKKFSNYEWVRYQLLSNLANAYSFSNGELKEMFRTVKEEQSPLVRLGYYLILTKHLNPSNQLFSALRQAIKNDPEPYIRNYVSGFVASKKTNTNTQDLKFWFGL